MPRTVDAYSLRLKTEPCVSGSCCKRTFLPKNMCVPICTKRKKRIIFNTILLVLLVCFNFSRNSAERKFPHILYYFARVSIETKCFLKRQHCVPLVCLLSSQPAAVCYSCQPRTSTLSPLFSANLCYYHTWPEKKQKSSPVCIQVPHPTKKNREKLFSLLFLLRFYITTKSIAFLYYFSLKTVYSLECFSSSSPAVQLQSFLFTSFPSFSLCSCFLRNDGENSENGKTMNKNVQ